MTTETYVDRLRRIDDDKEFIVCGITGKLLGFELSNKDYSFLFTEAKRSQRLEKENTRLKDDLIGTQEVVKKSVELLDKQEAYNARLRELVNTLKLHAVHCDSDGRAIQPYEIIDVINEFMEVGSSDN